MTLALLVISGLFFGWLGLTLCSHSLLFLLAWLDYRVRQYQIPTPPPLAATDWLRQCVREYGWMMSQFWRLPWRLQRYRLTTDKPTTSVIVCVHGFGRSQTDWRWLIPRLQQRVPQPVTCFSLRPVLQPIETLAAQLQHYLSTLQQQAQITEVILIGHSMGGLVCSYYAENLDQSLVSKVITLGTPYRGTKYAALAKGACSQQMVPGNPWLATLRQQVLQSKRRYFTVATPQDHLILPWETCLLDHLAPAQQATFAHHSHLGLIHSEPVLQQLVCWIHA